jgi:hypothetical protein
MNSTTKLNRFAAVAIVSMLATGLTAAEGMSKKEKSTAIGATSGAVAGAVVGGPVGAVVGAGVGAYVGHEGTKDSGNGNRHSSARGYNESDVRGIQQSLNDKGYDAGIVDGRWGPATESAIRKFQKANGLPETGALDAQTSAALGVSRPNS